jgi:hypothetical protein
LLGTPSRAGSRPTSVPVSPNPDRQDALRPVALVTPQQFHDHFTALTISTEHEQDSLYRDHLAEIIALRSKCDSILELLKDGEGEIDEMLRCLSYVEERSESLRGACEDLLEEQTHLLTHTSQLAHRLTFFMFLENAQRMLNSSASDLVLSADFLPMVKRLDECIGYLSDHVSSSNVQWILCLQQARFQRCRSLLVAVSAMYDEKYDLDQDLFHQYHQSHGTRGISETSGPGESSSTLQFGVY